MGGGHGETISVTLRVWRQDGPDEPGRFDVHHQTISTDASFLEMLDLLNEELNAAGEEPVAFESDCRETFDGALYYAKDAFEALDVMARIKGGEEVPLPLNVTAPKVEAAPEGEPAEELTWSEEEIARDILVVRLGERRDLGRHERSNAGQSDLVFELVGVRSRRDDG